jgi:hypothetical protein
MTITQNLSLHVQKNNIKNDHEKIEGQCVAGQGYETMSMTF